MRTEKEKMLAGDMYAAGDPELQADLAATERWLARFNAALSEPIESRRAILAERLAAVGRGTVVRPPFFCDYGYNIRLGDKVFVNYDCVFLDIVGIAVGDRTQIGPGVHIYAADHPRDPDVRRRGLEFGRPVTVGCDVWIGGGAVILPGVSIGDRAIVGAGSVVTKDVAAGVTVAGNPARPLAP